MLFISHTKFFEIGHFFLLELYKKKNSELP